MSPRKPGNSRNPRASPTSDSRRTFPPTPWSLIAKAANATPAARHQALDELLHRYLKPLRVHLVRIKKIDAGRVDDLLQGFIAGKVLEQELLARAQQGKGRFRSFILTVLDRYVIDQHRAEQARTARAKSFGAEALDTMPDGAAAPGDAVELAWAQEALQTALDLMREECQTGRRPQLWELFVARVVGPTLSGHEPVPYDELVKRFGFESPARASDALVTAKRMFARTLRRVIGEYAQEEEIDAEIHDLHEILARPRA